MKTTIDQALTRWCVVCQARAAFAAGDFAHVGAFLAGWYMRDMGVPEMDRRQLGARASSWLAGWREADQTLWIMARSEPHAFQWIGQERADSRHPQDRTCEVCGLQEADDCHRGGVHAV